MAAGSFKSDVSQKEFPKIQIITIKELLIGQKPDIPLWSKPYYKEAKKIEEDPKDKQHSFNL